MQKTLNIWKFTDGKQGHISQSDGLVAAIRKSHDVVEYVVDVNELPNAFFMFFMISDAKFMIFDAKFYISDYVFICCTICVA